MAVGKEYDELIEQVREAGVPCNRTSIGEVAMREFIGANTNDKGKVNITGIVEAMKVYHASNPKKLERQIAKLEEKLKAKKEALKELE